MPKISTVLLFLLLSITIANANEPIIPKDLPIEPPATMNVKELTSRQTFRFARELYLKGDYTAAVPIFKRMLEIDCNNPLAQYHLQKIAAKDKAFSDLTDYLKTLSCPVHDFSEEDFLPASLYYESDPNMTLEQLAEYNKRYRTARASAAKEISRYSATAASLESEVSALNLRLEDSNKRAVAAQASATEEIARYAATTASLETKVTELTAALETARKSTGPALAIKNEAIKKEIVAAQTVSFKVSAQVKKAKKKLTRKDRQRRKELAYLQARLAASEKAREDAAAISGNTSVPPKPSVAIAPKDVDLVQKTQELETLQEKLANVQTRLKKIEEDVAVKTTELNEIKSTLSTTTP